MSVRTTADEKIDSAKDHIRQAYKDIHDALDEDTWGSDEYGNDFVKKLHEVEVSLFEIKQKLK